MKMPNYTPKKENKSPGEIFDGIQEELHDQGKQQTTNILNNNIQNLHFRINMDRIKSQRNGKDDEEDDELLSTDERNEIGLTNM